MKGFLALWAATSAVICTIFALYYLVKRNRYDKATFFIVLAIYNQNLVSSWA